jgi:hypothetical protein
MNEWEYDVQPMFFAREILRLFLPVLVGWVIAVAAESITAVKRTRRWNEWLTLSFVPLVVFRLYWVFWISSVGFIRVENGVEVYGVEPNYLRQGTAVASVVLLFVLFMAVLRVAAEHSKTGAILTGLRGTAIVAVVIAHSDHLRILWKWL